MSIFALYFDKQALSLVADQSEVLHQWSHDAPIDWGKRDKFELFPSKDLGFILTGDVVWMLKLGAILRQHENGILVQNIDEFLIMLPTWLQEIRDQTRVMTTSCLYVWGFDSAGHLSVHVFDDHRGGDISAPKKCKPGLYISGQRPEDAEYIRATKIKNPQVDLPKVYKWTFNNFTDPNREYSGVDRQVWSDYRSGGLIYLQHSRNYINMKRMKGPDE
jgi:hypothetical protein